MRTRNTDNTEPLAGALLASDGVRHVALYPDAG
jgi:hypothetical protein